MEQIIALIPTLQKFSALILFIYLLRNVFKLRQFSLFAKRFNDNLNNSVNKAISMLKDKTKKDSSAKEPESLQEIPFSLGLDQIVNSFGYAFSPETFNHALANKHFNKVAWVVIIVQISVVSAITYFLFNISLGLISMVCAALLFLLLII